VPSRGSAQEAHQRLRTQRAARRPPAPVNLPCLLPLSGMGCGGLSDHQRRSRRWLSAGGRVTLVAVWSWGGAGDGRAGGPEGSSGPPSAGRGR
jgi:hypothetical protein